MAEALARWRRGWRGWAIGPALLLAAGLALFGPPAFAGIASRPVAEADSARAVLERLEAEDRQELHARLVQRLDRLERERRQAAAERRQAEQRLRLLAARFADLAEERRALDGDILARATEVTRWQARIEAMLAEIVHRSRDDEGDQRQLAQLRAVAASLAQPFADGKAALHEGEARLAGLEGRIALLRDRSRAARQALADGEAREALIEAQARDLRLSASHASARARAAFAMAGTTARRHAAIQESRRLAVATPARPYLADRLARPATGFAGRPVLLAPKALTASAVLTRSGTRAAVPFDPRGHDALAQGLSAQGAAKGQVIPVAGTVVGRFGDRRSPLFSRGLTIEVEDRRLVRAPRDGRVVFARIYGDFGLLLIIEHGGEYHSLLSGLSRLVIGEGDEVRAGQMVGTLEPADGRVARLYLELRRSGTPVDPQTWFVAGQDKVRS